MADEQNENKLVGTQYLNLGQLRKDVEETNKLLTSIGKNINIGLEKDLEKKIKASLDSIIKEVKEKYKDIQSISPANGLSKTSLQGGDGFKVDKIKEYKDEFGNLVKTVQTGTDAVGNSIQRVIKDGKVVSSVITGLSKESKQAQEEAREEAALWAEIEEDQRRARVEEKRLMEEIREDQRRARDEEKQIMRDLITEQNAYIAQQDAIAKRDDERRKRAREQDYGMLFDELDQKDIQQYIDSLKKQLQLVERINTANLAAESSKGEKDRNRWTQEADDAQELLKIEKDISEEIQNRNPSIANNGKVKEANKRISEAQKEGEKSLNLLYAERERKLKKIQTVQDQILRSVTHMILSYATRAVSEFWQDALSYSTQYYDRLNEIRIVTGMTESEANSLGGTYRKLAKDMSVSSTAIAEAATEFWRQGLDENEVNSRLKNTTQYAKISSLKFDEAAKLVTAATNSMDQSAQRVVDVFAYLGDASASGADEIGVAMQKAAATAQEAGQSFEWLGAYIATISEKTRQAPEVIGSSLNSIMSRLQSIKQKGYSEEDETKINDIAKALDNVHIKLMDDNKNWRDMSDIFMDIALQWGDMGDKMKSYIATTMAGTRQKNYFLTLMNDLSKVNSKTGEGSRAMELYQGAQESAGTAAEKYAIYEDSIAASNDRMVASFEKLFSLFNPELIKTWNDFWGTAAEGWAYIISGGKITPSVDHTSIISDLDNEINNLKPLIQEYESLNKTENRTVQQSARMEEVVKTLASTYPPLQKSLIDSEGKFLSGASAIEAMNAELEYAIELRREYVKFNLSQAANDKTGIEEAFEYRNSLSSKHSIFALINEAIKDSPFNGKSHIEDLNQAEMNSFGGIVNDLIDSKWLNAFYPDKEDRDLIRKEWDLFYDEYWDNMSKGYNMLRMLPADSQDVQKSYVKQASNSIMDYFLEGSSFDNLPSIAKEKAKEISQGIANGITEAEWDQGSDFVYMQIRSRTLTALDMYNKVFQDVNDWANDGSNEDFRYNLETEIEALNSIYGTTLKLDDILTILFPPTEMIDDALSDANGNAEDLQEQVDSLSKKLQESISGQELQALKDSGFASWLEELKGFAESGDEGGLFDWLLGKDKDQINAFIEAYPIFSEFFKSILDSSGAVDQTAGSWQDLIDMIVGATDTYNAWVEAYKKDREDDVSEAQGKDLTKTLTSAYDTEGLEGYRREWQRMTNAQRDWVKDNVDGGEEMADIVTGIADSTADATDAVKKMNREWRKMDAKELADVGKVWGDMDDIMDDLTKGGNDFTKTYASLTERVDKFVEAQEALAAIQGGTLSSTEDLEAAYEVLSSYTGISAESLKNNLSPAMWMLQTDADTVANSLTYMMQQLSAVSNVPFTVSNYQAQLAALCNDLNNTSHDAAVTVSALLSLAQGQVGMGPDGKIFVKLPNYSGTNFKPSTRRSSGGGGSKSNTGKEISEIEKMLDLMEQIQDIRDHQRDMLSEARNYYETTGELQGVIKYYEKERDAVLDNNKVLEDNIKKIEALLPAKQKEVAAMDTSDEAYEQAAKDLEGLQEAHQEYTKQLLANRTEVEEFNQAIKEQYDTIREMEIELRDTIMEAIKDREELEERMLEGRIDVENEILDLITARYEKERDEILETSEAKREALEEEKNLLDEQLEARKKAAEQEDKQLKLSQLQAKLERISADPTRKKEELELRKEIAELRDEMAWDLAEDEVEAQKESIDQQINSLDEYIEYVEKYYEDLFEHPTKLIEEMKAIISKTDDEIIAWLKQNSEDYAASTEATQQSMVNSWNEMLMDMHGSIEDYWDEVESIIAGGDDAIIGFLKENSADYKEAGKLQAEAYVDEWKKQLEDLEKVYRDVTDNIVNDTRYDTIKPATGNAGNPGGSGDTPTQPEAPTVYTFKFKNNKGTWSAGYTSDKMASLAFAEAKSAAINHWNSFKGQPGVADVLKLLANASVFDPGPYLRQFAKGGMADFTGPAWLDGTKMKPERILSAYQTELFEDMIASLHQIKVSAKSMPMIGYDSANAGQTFSFGDIVINAENLKTDEDYRAVAEQLMEYIMDAMSRGSAVGGIRMTR